MSESPGTDIEFMMPDQDGMRAGVGMAANLKQLFNNAQTGNERRARTARYGDSALIKMVQDKPNDNQSNFF